MALPSGRKDQSVYHTILSDMHRMRANLLNVQMIESGDTEPALREHFEREQRLILGRLSEWRQRRPEVYRQAQEDFSGQVLSET